MPCKRLFIIRLCCFADKFKPPRQTTGSYSLLTNGSSGVLSRQVEKRVQISSPSKGIISSSLSSMLVCELCWFCRVKARNNERETGLATDRVTAIPSVLQFSGGTVREQLKSVL